MKDYKLLIGARIKEKKISKNLTQEQLAELCNVSLGTISRVETGKTMVSIEMLLIIAESLDTDINYLLCDFAKCDVSDEPEVVECIKEFTKLSLKNKELIVNIMKLMKD